MFINKGDNISSVYFASVSFSKESKIENKRYVVLKIHCTLIEVNKFLDSTWG